MFSRDTYNKVTSNIFSKALFTASSVMALLPSGVDGFQKYMNGYGACFEANIVNDPVSHDYSLLCDSKSLLNQLVTVLNNTCHIFNDNDVFGDCANLFTDSKNFGNGFFPNSYRCTLYWHTESPENPCLIDTLEKNTPAGFGSFDDKVDTAAISIAAGLILCTASCAFFALKRRNKKAVVNEETPLRINEAAPSGPTRT